MVGDPGLDAAARWLVPHAQRHFAQANAILRARPQGLLAAPRLMETAYSRVLTRMVAQGWAAPRRRVKVSKPALLVLALRLWLFP
jgi:phytoene synthase